MKPLTRERIVQIVAEEFDESLRAAEQLSDRDRRIAHATLAPLMSAIRARLPKAASKESTND